jgi:hypothetical protein
LVKGKTLFTEQSFTRLFSNDKPSSVEKTLAALPGEPTNRNLRQSTATTGWPSNQVTTEPV